MRARSGLTLIEVIAALAILGIGAAAWAGLLGQGMLAARQAQTRDAQIRDAAAELARASVWTRSDFALHAGRSTLRGYLWSIAEIRPSLFDVEVADTVTGATLLRTSFFVRDSSAAAPQ